jgi:hypothetical protein
MKAVTKFKKRGGHPMADVKSASLGHSWIGDAHGVSLTIWIDAEHSQWGDGTERISKLVMTPEEAGELGRRLIEASKQERPRA